MLARRSYQRSQPTHCGSRFAESSLTGVREGATAQEHGQEPCKVHTCKREQKRMARDLGGGQT